MASVALQRVSKTFPNGVRAVNDVSLDVEHGEFLVLLGPSGCGKTTLLRMIAGLEPITEGVIRIGDRVVNHVPPKSRDIAMVFQNYALYPHMNVTDNIVLGLKLRHTPRPTISKRLAEAAGLLRLDGLLTRSPRQLSGGQQQRVALGRTIVRQPLVFLMDEPLSNLDARLRVHTRTELIKLHRRVQTTFIYVTHDQSEAMTMASRIAVMRDGAVQQCAPPLTVYRHPVNRYVAGFLGSPEMNFLDAIVDISGDGIDVRGPGFRLRLPTDRTPSLGPYANRQITLGVRPEMLSLENGSDRGHLEARVDVVEPTGGRTLVYCQVGDQSVVADVEADLAPAAGDRVELALVPSQLLAFDAESGEALWT